jgi:hypothetical protein
VPCGALCSSSLIREASPARRGYTDLGCQGARRLLQRRTFVAPSAISVMSLGPYVELSTFVHAPFSYKRGGMRRYKTSSIFGLRPKFIQTLKLSSNTTHSGVGYYAPAARTTLNSCVFLCSFLHLATSKTLRPLLILGLRAGALRHPAGDFLSDIWHAR